MRRREFIGLVGGVAVWPLAVQAQQPVPVIGYLSARSAEVDVPMMAALRQGLAEAGFVEGRDFRIETRFADGQYDRLPGLAAFCASLLPPGAGGPDPRTLAEDVERFAWRLPPSARIMLRLGVTSVAALGRRGTKDGAGGEAADHVLARG